MGGQEAEEWRGGDVKIRSVVYTFKGAAVRAQHLLASRAWGCILLKEWTDLSLIWLDDSDVIQGTTLIIVSCCVKSLEGKIETW